MSGVMDPQRTTLAGAAPAMPAPRCQPAVMIYCAYVRVRVGDNFDIDVKQMLLNEQCSYYDFHIVENKAPT